MTIQIEIKVFWIIGLVISTAALAFQAVIYILVPCSRRLPLKLLTQMTVARLLNVGLEYTITAVPLYNPALNDAVYALYFHTDAALICWMFVFTKNMYEDIIAVFKQKIGFVTVTIIVWLLTLPIGLLGFLMLKLDAKQQNFEESKNFSVFYRTYSAIKFAVLTLNLVMFAFIFKVALAKGKIILRTCVVSFCLVSISSVQVFVSDILTSVTDGYPMVSLVFGVINAYQIVAITAMFVIFVQNISEESLTKKLTKKFVRETV